MEEDSAMAPGPCVKDHDRSRQDDHGGEILLITLCISPHRITKHSPNKRC